MDEGGGLSIALLERKLIFVEFQENLSIMTEWAEELWSTKEADYNLYGKIISNSKYWSRELKPVMTELTILVTLFKAGRIYNTNEKEWISFMRECNCIEEFSFFFGTRNPNIVGIKFKSSKGKEELLKKLFMWNDGFIVNLELFNNSKEIKIRLHWLPHGFYEEEFKSLLAKYVEVLEYKREMIMFDDSLSYPSKIVNIKAILRCDNIDNIPHLIRFKGIQILIVITSRKPMCLKCENLGHKAFECDMKFCRECKIYHKKSYICTEKNEMVSSTYAQIIKNFKIKAELKINKFTTHNNKTAGKYQSPEVSDNIKTTTISQKETELKQLEEKMIESNQEHEQKADELDLKERSKQASRTYEDTENKFSDQEKEENIEEEERMDTQEVKCKRHFEKDKEEKTEKNTKSSDKKTIRKSYGKVATPTSYLFDKLTKK